MKKILTVLSALVIAAVAVVFLLNMNTSDYASAYEKTKKLENYKMSISTIVTIRRGEDVKQSAIDQTVRVSNRGKDGMCYEVLTDATSTDVTSGNISNETNSYIYSNGSYYYAYPGVKYKMPAEHTAAIENVNNLTDIISFEPNELLNLSSYDESGETVYEYQVDFENVSPFVQAALKSAVQTFDEGVFSAEDIWASSCVSGEYITKGEFSVTYSSGEENSVIVEVYTELLNSDEKVERPDESEYVEIAG